jgi:hypothetical protein
MDAWIGLVGALAGVAMAWASACLEAGCPHQVAQLTGAAARPPGGRVIYTGSLISSVTISEQAADCRAAAAPRWWAFRAVGTSGR